MTGPRIALIHATPVAMEPVAHAFAQDWPEATLVNLLDDSLSGDRAAAAALTPALTDRMVALARYAEGLGASGILYTCSAFGPAIEVAAAAVSVPVLKPNQAMFEAALHAGRRLGLLATFQPAVASMAEEFEAMAGANARLETRVVPAAMAALRSGDVAAHNRLLADSAPALAGCDAVMLAHFSTSRARQAVAAVLDCPVLTSPNSAVARLRALVGA